jgi:hypothetical protein
MSTTLLKTSVADLSDGGVTTHAARLSIVTQMKKCAMQRKYIEELSAAFKNLKEENDALVLKYESRDDFEDVVGPWPLETHHSDKTQSQLAGFISQLSQLKNGAPIKKRRVRELVKELIALKKMNEILSSLREQV